MFTSSPFFSVNSSNGREERELDLKKRDSVLKPCFLRQDEKLKGCYFLFSSVYKKVNNVALSNTSSNGNKNWSMLLRITVCITSQSS